MFFLIILVGRPESKIKWWRGESLLESDEVISGIDNVKSNQVIIESVQRSDQHAILTCQASNNNISQPSSISVLIEIYCKFKFRSIFQTFEKILLK